MSMAGRGQTSFATAGTTSRTTIRARYGRLYITLPPESRFPTPGNGNFEFMDPRGGNVHGGKEIVRPEPGLLMVFPAWLNHYVNPYHGDGERISIAWNFNVEILR